MNIAGRAIPDGHLQGKAILADRLAERFGQIGIPGCRDYDFTRISHAAFATDQSGGDTCGAVLVGGGRKLRGTYGFGGVAADAH